jgi:large subunit ribosomal protein L6
MSRIGKKIIQVPSGVEVKISADAVVVKGSKGELSSPLFDGITVSQEGATLTLSCSDLENKKLKALYGLASASLANNVKGVSAGFERELELRGVGYRAQAQGNALNLSLGFSHPVVYQLPTGISAKVDQSKIIISGSDKQKVGQVAAEIRAIRPPEPYKGKGVRYTDEYVAMKEGKKA